MHCGHAQDLRRHVRLDEPAQEHEDESSGSLVLPSGVPNAEELCIAEEEEREQDREKRAERVGWLVWFFVYASQIEKRQGKPGSKRRRTFVENLVILLQLKATETSVDVGAKRLGLKRPTLDKRLSRVRKALLREEHLLAFCIGHGLPLQYLPGFYDLLRNLLYLY